VKQKIQGNGVVGNAVNSTNSEKIRVKIGGDLDGGTVSFFEWYGEGTANLNDSEWALFNTLSAESVGANGFEYNIGTDIDWYASVAGAGTPDAYLIVSPIDLGA